jgi:glucosamine--fructose-6-phosphate aminotransferase (isomerizing)
MCGIIGIIGNLDIKSNILLSLKNLTNRGYDSVGIFFKDYRDNHIIRKISDHDSNAIDKLDKILNEENISTDIGLGHTRWATHGGITVENTHPHISNNSNIILVHNGVINNYFDIKKKLIKNGYTFYSQTDSEVIVNLLEYYYSKTDDMIKTINCVMEELDGTYGICLYFKDNPNKLYCFKNGSPIVISKHNNFAMVTSEITGFNGLTKTYFLLNNKDICVINKDTNGDITIETEKSYSEKLITNEVNDYVNNSFEHWTLKEIHEQKDSLLRAINNGGRIKDNISVNLGGLHDIFNIYKIEDYETLVIIGCGTSFYSAKVATFYFKEITHFNTILALDGCEFSYNDIPKNTTTLAILISQSGETRDLIVCLEILKEKQITTIGCINKVDSLLATETDGGVYLNAGIERGVASTKSFTSQLIVLKMISLLFSERNIKSILNIRKKSIERIINLTNTIDYVLNNTKIVEYAEKIKNKTSLFLLGKGIYFPIAEEGTLKIKELSYIHAEAYSGSALKHGPFSLLQDGFPVILIIHKDIHYKKMRITFEEIKTRKGDILVLTNDSDFPHHQKIVINDENTVSEIQYIILLQRLAYYLAIKKGINPDYPRNLAKVVTVD